MNDCNFLQLRCQKAGQTKFCRKWKW